MTKQLGQSIGDHAYGQAWSSELRRVALQCVDNAAPDDPSLIRDAHRLLSGSPAAADDLVGVLPARKLIEALLTLRAYESAVLRMLPEQLGYLLSRGPGRSYWLASSCLEGRNEDVTCRASSAAAALLGAYLSELAEFFEAKSTTWPLRSALN